jgi:hypothetical protein
LVIIIWRRQWPVSGWHFDELKFGFGHTVSAGECQQFGALTSMTGLWTTNWDRQ